MKPCCCCSNRLGVVFLGTILTMNFAIQLLMTFLHRDYLNVWIGESQVPGVYASQGIMLLMSLLVILAAVYKNRWLLLPFIIFAMICEFCVVILAISIIINTVGQMNNTLLAALGNALFTLFFISWSLWATIAYFFELGRSDSYSELEGQRNPAGNESDTDGGYPPLREKHGNHGFVGRKMTVVSKMLRDFK